MFQPLIEVAFLLIYAALLAAVTPYVRADQENYGVLIPGALAISTGAIVWSLLTWLGLPDTDGWIWGLTMVLMPVGMAFGIKYYGRGRSQGKFGFVDQLGKAIADASAKNNTENAGGEEVVILTSTAGN
ncbi:MAG: hypothetical protein RJA26_260 [Actinomycetota bacterium]